LSLLLHGHLLLHVLLILRVRMKLLLALNGLYGLLLGRCVD
jgi:hypothetical protein